jgi:cell division protein ZapA (FtsZ GTPase activity inhibitor)
MTNKKSVAVRIAGHEYKVLTDGDEETLQQIAADVDKAMRQVREKTQTVDTFDVAVLTCLNLAREIIELRSPLSTTAPRDRLRGLIDRVEALLPEHEVLADTGKGTADKALKKTKKSKPSEPVELSKVEPLRDAQPPSATNEAPRVAAGGRKRAS